MRCWYCCLSSLEWKILLIRPSILVFSRGFHTKRISQVIVLRSGLRPLLLLRLFILYTFMYTFLHILQIWFPCNYFFASLSFFVFSLFVSFLSLASLYAFNFSCLSFQCSHRFCLNYFGTHDIEVSFRSISPKWSHYTLYLECYCFYDHLLYIHACMNFYTFDIFDFLVLLRPFILYTCM